MAVTSKKYERASGRAPRQARPGTGRGAAAAAVGLASTPVVAVALPAGHEGAVTVLGIDPGKHSGLAWFTGGKLLALEEVEPAELAIVLVEKRPMVVIFEDSRQAKSVWTGEGTQAKRAAMARNVGEIDAWCKLIEAICKRLGIACYGMAPSAKAGGYKGAKINAEAFNRFTGWVGKSNQHCRDAAMIAWPFRRVAK